MNPNIPHSHRLLSVAAAGFAGFALIVTASVRGAATPATPAAPAAAAAAAAPAAAPAAPAKAVAFADVKPLFEKYCYACHGGDLAPAGTAPNSVGKGGLKLDTLANVIKGGRNSATKPGIVAGKPEASEIIHRITLAPDHKDIMPQKGKPAPTAAEVQQIVDWVKAGAK